MSAARYFLTYRGVRLPLQLTEELAPEAMSHRNTWFEARYDAAARVVAIDQLVYGEVALSHRYVYDAQGRLLQATITQGDEAPRVLQLTPAD